MTEHAVQNSAQQWPLVAKKKKFLTISRYDESKKVNFIHLNRQDQTNYPGCTSLLVERMKEYMKKWTLVLHNFSGGEFVIATNWHH